MNKISRIIGLVSISFLVMIITGCTNKQAIAAELIASVQKDVPFTIVVPTYFPRDVKVIPIGISAPTTNEITNSVWVGITYYGSSSEKTIILYEENREMNLVPTGSYETFNVNDIEVIDEPTTMGSATKITHGFLYSWNRDGVNFQVRLFGYNQTEGKKIVESMIK